jgi:hypothetical protein
VHGMAQFAAALVVARQAVIGVVLAHRDEITNRLLHAY